MVGGQIPDADSLKQLLKSNGDAIDGEEEIEPEEKVKSLLKGLLN